jgi:hypothetical protein
VISAIFKHNGETVTIRDIIESLPAHVVCGCVGADIAAPERIVACDMMSDLLVSPDEEMFLVTSLATDQTIRSAVVAGASLVLLVNDKLPLPSMKKLALENGISLLATPMPMFESCAILDRLRSLHGQAN